MRRAAYVSIALLLGASTLVACGEGPARVLVDFPETGGLKAGDNVTLRGLAIGQVRDIDIAAGARGVSVVVEVQPKFKDHLRQGVSFRIEQEKMVTGKQRLVLEPADTPGAPLADGVHVAGRSIAPDAVDRLRGALEGSVDHAKEQATGLGRAILNPDEQPPTRATGGTVDLDRPGGYVVRLISVKVDPKTADGSDWDGMGGGEPDLLGQVWVGERQVLLTPVADDTLEAQWDATSEGFDLSPELAIRVKILDRDVSLNDEIGVLELRPTEADAATGRVFRLAGGRVLEARLVVGRLADR